MSARSGSVVHWNPRRPVIGGPIGKLIPVRRRVRNFGDLLGPLIVSKMLARSGIDPNTAPRHDLLSVGSILHFADDGATVWGTGINGKVDPSAHRFEHLDVRAVRGPRTRERLLDLGIRTPEVFGDPGLLVSVLWSRNDWLGARTERTSPVTIIPNLNDMRRYDRSDPRIVDPRRPVAEVIAQVLQSELVVASSLHGVVVADAFGVPAALVRSPHEPIFKYEDYFFGTGRGTVPAHKDAATAIRRGPHEPLRWEPNALLDAFPTDIFTRIER